MQSDFNERKNQIYCLTEQSWDNILQGFENQDVYEKIAVVSRSFVSVIKNNTVELFPGCGIVAAQRETGNEHCLQKYFYRNST